LIEATPKDGSRKMGRPRKRPREQAQILYRLDAVWSRQPDVSLNDLLLKLGDGKRLDDAALLEKLRAGVREPEAD
jgi:hypothetical protein